MRFDRAVVWTALVAAAAVSAQLTVVDSDGDDEGYSEYYYPTSAFGQSNMTALGTWAARFEAQLRERNETSAVRLQLHMWWLRGGGGGGGDDGGVAVRGCGFRAQAGGDRNGTAAVRFPAVREHVCDDGGTYMMRTTSAAAPVVYEARLHLPGPSERARWVQVHADGHRRTYVELACVGTHDRSAGYRTMCVDRPALDACARHTGDSTAAFADAGRIPMSRTSAGVRALVFRHLDSAFAGFWALVRNASDRAARSAFCDGVVWLLGTADPGRYCDAETAYNVRKYGWNSMDPVPMNPDLCVPVTTS